MTKMGKEKKRRENEGRERKWKRGSGDRRKKIITHTGSVTTYHGPTRYCRRHRPRPALATDTFWPMVGWEFLPVKVLGRALLH